MVAILSVGLRALSVCRESLQLWLHILRYLWESIASENYLLSKRILASDRMLQYKATVDVFMYIVFASHYVEQRSCLSIQNLNDLQNISWYANFLGLHLRHILRVYVSLTKP